MDDFSFKGSIPQVKQEEQKAPEMPQKIEKWVDESNNKLERYNDNHRVVDVDDIRNGWDLFFRIAFIVVLIGGVAIFLYLISNDHFKSSVILNNTLVCERQNLTIPACPTLTCPNITCQKTDCHMNCTMPSNLNIYLHNSS